MCGHFGVGSVIGGLSQAKRTDIMSEGLYIDALRGWDSTGVAAIDLAYPKDKPIVLKRAIPAADFLNWGPFNRLLADRWSVMIGHNRWATRGRVNDDAAHPYQHGPITLAHNGTLDYFTNLEGQFETDSEEIPHTMAKLGEQETLERINGAYALVWYNHEKGTLNFARNDDRPLFYTFTKDKKNIFWASEINMLKLILSRNDVEYETIWNPQPGSWFSFDMTGTTIKEEITSFKEYIDTYAGKYYSAGGRGSTNSYSDAKQKIYDALGLHEDAFVCTVVDEACIKRSNTITQKGRELYNVAAPTLLEYKDDTGDTHTPIMHIYTIDSETIEYWRDAYGNKEGKIQPFYLYIPATSAYHPTSTVPNADGGKNVFLSGGKEFAYDLDSVVGLKAKGITAEPVVNLADDGGDKDVYDMKIKGPLGEYLEHDEAVILLSDGCSYCGKHLVPGMLNEPNGFTWDDTSGEPICEDCFSYLQLNQQYPAH